MTFADATSASTSFTMPGKAVTVKATFEADNGGGGGGGGSGGGGTPTSIGLDEEALSLKPGGTAKLKATVKPVGAAVVWASTDPGVASVSPDGTVTAYKAGMAVITATSGGRLAFCVVTVAGEGTPGPGPEVVSIALDRTSMDLSVGDAATLTATVDPAGAAVTYSVISSARSLAKLAIYSGVRWMQTGPPASGACFAPTMSRLKPAAILPRCSGVSEAR